MFFFLLGMWLFITRRPALFENMRRLRKMAGLNTVLCHARNDESVDQSKDSSVSSPTFKSRVSVLGRPEQTDKKKTGQNGVVYWYHSKLLPMKTRK